MRPTEGNDAIREENLNAEKIDSDESNKPIIGSAINDKLIKYIETWLADTNVMFRYILSLIADLLATFFMILMIMSMHEQKSLIGIVGKVFEFFKKIPLEIMGIIAFLLICMQTQYFSNGYIFVLLGLAYLYCGYYNSGVEGFLLISNGVILSIFGLLKSGMIPISGDSIFRIFEYTSIGFLTLNLVGLFLKYSKDNTIMFKNLAKGHDTLELGKLLCTQNQILT